MPRPFNTIKSILKNSLLKFKNFLANMEEDRFWAVLYTTIITSILTIYYFLKMIFKDIK